MKKVKVVSRVLTNKGTFLYTTEDDRNFSINKEKMEMLKLADLKLPAIGDEVTVKPSVDAARNESTQWYDLHI